MIINTTFIPLLMQIMFELGQIKKSEIWQEEPESEVTNYSVIQKVKKSRKENLYFNSVYRLQETRATMALC